MIIVSTDWVKTLALQTKKNLQKSLSTTEVVKKPVFLVRLMIQEMKAGFHIHFSPEINTLPKKGYESLENKHSLINDSLNLSGF